ncbi:MAG: DUF971 domain-containing protein [Chloroflexi bacterium]|nr:DUF971 domain-containing protein [Chloroflexota bacterium]
MHQPKTIVLRPDGIHIAWDDGHEGFHPYRALRGACPCATCVHEMTGQRVIGTDDVPEGVEALDHMSVGRYALQFLWSDAHQTGIYPYELLRRLCKCDACEAARV